MWRVAGTLLGCGVAVCLLCTVVPAAPYHMTDADLDEVSASGGINIGVDSNDGSFTFNFDQGMTAGYGSVTTTPAIPSTLTAGSVNLSNALVNVENMIFNLNVCVQCSGNIFQVGIGIPITIKSAP